MPRYDIDYLIIGQGLAGSMLAWHLIHEGQRVLVVDDAHPGAASRVAAGLINPLAGMRFNRRPELPNWLASAQSWYDRVASVCDGAVLHHQPMLRLFRSTEQQRFHTRRLEDPQTENLLGPRLTAERMPEPVHAPHGGFLQRRTGYVALNRLLSKLREWLVAQRAFELGSIDSAELKPTRNAVSWKNLVARHAVLCTGARLADDPWFGYLPLTLDKGELLTLRSLDDWQPKHIINGHHWLLPHEDGRLRFGATHDHHDRSTGTTDRARVTLKQGLTTLLPKQKFQTVEQLAGIRPGTTDRYPLTGRHPVFPCLCVCNGFGARGSLSAPWYTEQLARHLVHGTPLPAEADTARFAT